MSNHKAVRRMPYLASMALTLAAITLLTGASVSGADWGSLKGRFVFDGKAEDPTPLNVNKDVEYCSQHNPVDETLEVDDAGGLGNVLVYLYLKSGKTVDVHPDLEAPGDEPAVLDNKGCRFEPHVTLLRVNQPLEIKNTDTIAHNTNFETIKNPQFNQIIAAANSLTRSFEKRESYPSSVVCNIHPWMKSYVLIRDNPYMAVSAGKGSFEIRNLPAGSHEFIFWHESPGNLRSLAVGKTKTSRKGRAKLTIPAGETLDLGDIKVSAQVLGK